MKIYFAGSISGGIDDIKLYHKLIGHLSKYGKVLTKHLGNVNITASGEKLNSKETYERDVRWLGESDIMVAEISTPSLGVGYELCKAEWLGIPILCLYRKSSLKKPSAMITGNHIFKISQYEDLNAAFKEIDTFISDK